MAEPEGVEGMCASLYLHPFVHAPKITTQTLIGVVQVISSVLIVVFVARRRREQRRASSEVLCVADFLLLPIYQLILLAFVMADALFGTAVVLCPNNFTTRLSLHCAVFRGVGLGTSHAVIEGTAMLLAQYSAGINSFAQVGKFAIVWGTAYGTAASVVMHNLQQDWALYVLIAFDVMFAVGYAVLWLAPPQVLFRRPALLQYAMFWVIAFSLSAVSYYLILMRMDVGLCLYSADSCFLWSLCKPFVLFVVLRNDSLYWQGAVQLNGLAEFGYMRWMKKQGLVFEDHVQHTPSLGFRATQHAPPLPSSSARELAVRLDEARRSEAHQVPMLNFACLSLGVGKVIGAGGTSKVYHGTMLGTPVAIKVLYAMELDPATVQRFVNEATLLARLKHPNIVEVKGMCVVPPSVCLVMELCARGNLHNEIKSNWHSLSWQQRLSMSVDCARGLAFLHSLLPPILHNDVKSPNFCVDGQGCVKLLDLDFSTSSGSAPAVPAAFNWVAPEVLEHREFGTAADCYGLAMVLYELATGFVPFGTVRMNDADLKCEIIAGARPTTGMDIVPTELAELIRELWGQDPTRRPSALEAAGRIDRMMFLPWANRRRPATSPRSFSRGSPRLGTPLLSPRTPLLLGTSPGVFGSVGGRDSRLSVSAPPRGPAYDDLNEEEGGERESGKRESEEGEEKDEQVGV